MGSLFHLFIVIAELPDNYEICYADIDNIKIKTGKTPDDFKKLAEQKGFLQKGELKNGIKAGEIVAWLKKDFDLGHGHAMAIYAVFKGVKQAKLSGG